MNSKIFGNNKSLRAHMIFSGIAKPVSMIVSYIYVPLVLNYLGTEKYGVWATMLALVSWISFFDVGIGNGLRNKLTESLTLKDGRSNKLVSSAYCYISIIMLSAIVIFCLFAQYINWEKVLGIKITFDENILFIVISCFFFVAINFILSLCKNILFAIQKAAHVSILELCVQIINLICILLLKSFSKSNLLFVSLAYGISIFTVNLIVTIIIFLKKPDVRPSFNNIDFVEGKCLTGLGLKFFIIQICALVLFTTDNVIIARLYGSSYVTPYYTANKLFSALSGLFAALLVPIWSEVTRGKVSKDFMQLKKILYKLNLLIIPFVILSIMILFVFETLMKFWLHQNLDFSFLLIVFSSIYCILTMWCNIYSTFANGLELMNVSLVIAVIQAVINIPLSLFFAITLKMQSSGILLGTICSMTIAAIFLPIVVIHKVKDLIKEI